MPELPTGTVTFLFTDIEGSTQRWEKHHAAMTLALARHDALVRESILARGGHIFKTIGDAFQVAFGDPIDAILAAAEAQRALAAEDWSACGDGFPALRVRMALHVGPAAPDADGDYRTPLLNRVARLMSAGHGGQVLLSTALWELVRDNLPEAVTLRDLGERRLKDLRRPEHVFQLLAPELPADFPPLATLDARPNNLPVQLTSFVGREREMAEVKRMLGASHLVTLTGIGGTGKTRLSLQAAADLIDDFDHGVWFVDLASIVDEALVASTVARVLGLREEPGRAIEATLVDGLKAKRLLLVLDNCEHLVNACSHVASAILRAAPGVKILATSRRALNIAGEQRWPVSPLAVPEVGKAPLGVEIVGQYAAVRLFIDRAVAVKPDFAVTNANAPAVAGVCARLDGIPLAIELAAARVKMLSPDALFTRLDSRLRLLTTGARDVPARQQTLAGAIAWSYDLLDPDGQQLFRRLAVFVGGATLDAVESVCNADRALRLDVLDGMAVLVETSLVEAGDGATGEPRFTMLETIREFAQAALVASGAAAAIQAAHYAYYLDLAQTANPHLDAGDQVEWLARLAEEEDNLRAALGWAMGPLAHPGAAVRMGAACWRGWGLRGRFREMAEWPERILAHTPPEIEPQARAMLVYHAAGVAGVLRDRTKVEILFPEAIQLFREQGDLRHLGWALNDFGNFFVAANDPDRAETLLADSLAVRRQLGDSYEIATGLASLGELARLRGEFDRAEAILEECLVLYARPDAAGAAINLAMALHNLGHLRRRAGDFEHAVELFGESMGINRKVDSAAGVAVCLAGFGGVAAAADLPHRAARLLGAASHALEDLAMQLDLTDQREFDASVALARAGLDEATWAAAWAEGVALDLEAAVAYALEESRPWPGTSAGMQDTDG